MPDELRDVIEKVQGMAGNAKESDVPKEPGPGDVGPTIQTKNQSPLVTLKMSEEECSDWWKRIERARARVKNREGMWDILLKEYLPIVSASGSAETVKVNGHFRNVHSKIGQMFFRSPDLTLEPDDPGPAQNEKPNPMQMQMPPGAPPLPPLKMEDIIAIKQAVLKKKLGRDGIKANRLMDELNFDVLAWTGIAACKVGFRCVFKTIQKPKMVPGQPTPSTNPLMPAAPPPMMPATDPMTGEAIMEAVKVPIFEEYYARRLSPKKLLFDDGLKSTRYDEDAAWMGMEFFLSPRTAMKPVEEGGLGLTEDEAKSSAKDDRCYQYVEDSSAEAPGLIRCVEIYAKASIYTDEVHPQALNQLILVEGIKTKPFVWRPSPDQEFDPETGKLSNDSVIGFPFRVLTHRDMADSPYPLPDSAYTNSGLKQLGTWRRQSVRMRDANIGKFLYDTAAFDQPEVELLKNGEIGEFIPVQDGKLAQGVDKVFASTAKIQSTADDQRGQQIIKQDNDETIGLGSNAAGVETETVRTATESNNVASAVQARNEKERGRSIDFYLDLARMVDQLLMRYADQDEYIMVGGEEAVRKMAVWNGSLVSGKYLYDITPDSQLQVDTSQEFNLDMKLYNIAAQDPLFNRTYMLRRMARRRGLDPAKIIADPMMMQPPHGGPGGTVSQHEQAKSGGTENAPGAENARAEQIK